MSVININLIKKSQQYRKIAHYSRVVKIGTVLLLAFLLISNAVIFLINQRVQQKFKDINFDYQSLLANTKDNTQEAGRIAFTYEKLKKIKELYSLSPEYYAQYKYMINTILSDSDVEIKDLQFDGAKKATMSIVAQDINELFGVIKRIEKEQAKKNFENISLKNIQMKLADSKDQKIKVYTTSLTFQFNNTFADAGTGKPE